MEHTGKRIRETRLRRGWTLHELSARCGLSTTFLSQVERGRSSLSIVSLSAICGALDIPAASLVSTNRPSSAVTRAAHQPTIEVPSSPVTYRWLSGFFRERQIEVLVGKLPPRVLASACCARRRGVRLCSGRGTVSVRGGGGVRACPGRQPSYPCSGLPRIPDTSRDWTKVLWSLTQQCIEWHNQMRSAALEVHDRRTEPFAK